MCRRHDFDVIVWTLRRVDFEINSLTPEPIGIGSNHSNGIHFEPWGCQKYDRSDAPIRGLREKWPFVSKIHLRVGCELRDPK